MIGLSPRVRGNLCKGDKMPLPVRSIPACAGEPPDAGARRGGTGVYPRVCGGTLQYTDMRVALRGLSPRVRGNHQHPVHQRTTGRSIPACAGEPSCSMWLGVSSGVYPRVCGGTLILHLCWPLGSGLSPRVRGNPLLATHCLALRRSIPACAGEPPSPSPPSGRA